MKQWLLWFTFIVILLSRVPIPADVVDYDLPGSSQTASELYAQAGTLFKQGQYEATLEYLRQLRIQYPASDWLDKSLLLSARACLVMEETFRARYFLKKLVTESYNETETRQAAFLLGEVLFQDRLYAEAAGHYQFGLKLAVKAGISLSMDPDIARAHLRLAQVAYYQDNDIELARSHISPVNRLLLSETDLAVYNLLRQKLVWKNISPEDIGVEDGNISAITVDGDDLWIGTWSGGLVRFSYSNGRIRVFKEGLNSIADNAIRAIEVDSRRVWVGTYNGLSIYLKTNSTWQQVERFGNTRPGKISVIKKIGSTIYVGTLGNGLWQFAGNSWSRVDDTGAPGNYILCLEEGPENIYIGTMTRGIFLKQKSGSRIRNFDDLVPGLEPRNITMLLLDSGGQRLWIGTYGEGLVMWHRQVNSLSFFSRDSGEIKDDWVLCGVETDLGLYFGTFGGGVSFFSPGDNRWQSIGLEQGLVSLDIASMAYSRPDVYFGTLGTGISIFREEPDD